jgi:two-component system chemotaxis response regulator CheB
LTKVAAQAEFDAVLDRLGKRIKSAKGLNLKKLQASVALAMPGEWNGRLIAIGAEASNTQQLFNFFAALPKDCPPILVVQHLGAGLVESLVERLDGKIQPKIVVAGDGTPIEQGTIYFAPQGDKHMVIDAWPQGRCRLIDRDPVGGERPSISLLYASLAKTAGADAIAILLPVEHEDGLPGMRPLLAAGGIGVTQVEGGFTLTRGENAQRLPGDKIVAAMLKLASK